MSAEKKQDDLNAFEAALAALAPRTDRLDRDRLMFLAGQQSVLTGHITTSGATAGLSSSVGGTAGQAGHQPKVAHGSHAWRWPAAFAAMSAVAATLLMMLVFRPGPGRVENAAGQTAPRSALATDSLALVLSTDNRKFSEAASPYSNSAMLQQILTKGIDSWRPRTTGSNDTNSIITRPLNNRELMNQLIKEKEGA